MNNYTLNIVNEVNGKINVFKLCKNGNCYLDIFEQNLQKLQTSEFIRIFRLVQTKIDGHKLTKEQYRVLGEIEQSQYFEFKKNAMRVYGFYENNNMVLIDGSTNKDKQTQMIHHIEDILKDYLRNKEDII